MTASRIIGIGLCLLVLGWYGAIDGGFVNPNRSGITMMLSGVIGMLVPFALIGFIVLLLAAGGKQNTKDEVNIHEDAPETKQAQTSKKTAARG